MSTEFNETSLRYGAADAALQAELPVRRPRGGQAVVALSMTALLTTSCSSGTGGTDYYPLPSESAATEAGPLPSELETFTPTPMPTEEVVTPAATPTPVPTRSHATSKEAYTAVYFQPLTANLENPKEQLEGVYIMVAEPGAPNSWTNTEQCDPRNAASFLERPGAADIHDIIGFSLGRIGLPYVLNTTSRDQQRQFNYAIIIDPGNMEDMSNSCDPPETSTAILNWLSIDPRNRLVIMAGSRTAEDNLKSIRAKYAAGISGAGLGKQVILCTNLALSHYETWQHSKNLIGRSRITTPAACPVGFGGSHL